MYVSPKKKEMLIDSAIMFCLFYIIGNEKTYAFTKSVLPKSLYSDPVMTHAFVFALCYMFIQKIGNRF